MELIGGFSPEPEYEQISPGVLQTTQFIGDARSGTIYAVTDSGKKISLWGADRGNVKASGHGQVVEEFWRAAWVCVGAHIPSAEIAEIDHLSVGLDSLYYLTADGRFCPPQWIQIEGVDHAGERQEDGTLMMPYMLPVAGGHRASVALGSLGDRRYRIGTRATYPWVSPATEAMPDLKFDMMTRRRRRGPSIELEVSAYAYVDRGAGSATSAATLLQSMSPLLGLMSLATFDTAGVEWLQGRTCGGDEISLLCRTGNESQPDQVVEPSALVFTLNDVTLQQFLDAWSTLTSGEQAKYAWSIVVGLIGHSPLMVEEQVGQVLAAAEGFHTWCLGGGKSKSLESRLISLHEELPTPIKEQLNINVKQWSDWSVWARNHVAHGGAKEHRPVGDFYLLKVVADSVRLVTYLVALKKIGVPVIKMTDALLNHPRLQVLADRCAELSSLPTPPD